MFFSADWYWWGFFIFLHFHTIFDYFCRSPPTFFASFVYRLSSSGRRQITLLAAFIILRHASIADAIFQLVFIASITFSLIYCFRYVFAITIFHWLLLIASDAISVSACLLSPHFRFVFHCFSIATCRFICLFYATFRHCPPSNVSFLSDFQPVTATSWLRHFFATLPIRQASAFFRHFRYYAAASDAISVFRHISRSILRHCWIAFFVALTFSSSKLLPPELFRFITLRLSHRCFLRLRRHLFSSLDFLYTSADFLHWVSLAVSRSFFSFAIAFAFDYVFLRLRLA